MKELGEFDQRWRMGPASGNTDPPPLGERLIVSVLDPLRPGYYRLAIVEVLSDDTLWQEGDAWGWDLSEVVHWCPVAEVFPMGPVCSYAPVEGRV